MEIQRLKKRLIREELRRRRPNRRRNLCLALVGILMVAAAAGGYYRIRQQNQLPLRFERAEQLVVAGDYAGAARLLEAIPGLRSDFPDAPRALFRAAEIRTLFEKDYPAAIRLYGRLVQEYPQSPLALASLQKIAEIYKYRLHDYPRAIVAYQKLSDLELPEDDRWRYEVADSYFRLNNFEQARIEFETLAAKYPGSPLVPEVSYRIAVTHTLEGNRNKGEAAYRAVAAEWPDSPFAIEARFGLGELLEDQERLREALEIFQQLRGAYPSASTLEQKIDQLQKRIDKKKKAI